MDEKDIFWKSLIIRYFLSPFLDLHSVFPLVGFITDYHKWSTTNEADLIKTG